MDIARAPRYSVGMKDSSDGEDRFNQFYLTVYGRRWLSLREALLKKAAPIGFSESLLETYYLDEASVIAASLLPVQQGDRVLDMCAAPGGKALVLASALKGRGALICNDRSRERRMRLHRVLEEYLPPAWRTMVTVTGHDATRWGLHEQSTYDAVLLDAPCSSERHVLQDAKALSQWSSARTKRLAVQQFAMVAAALEAVRPGGHILYSTCSISPSENEAVIEKLEKKRAGRYEEIAVDAPYAQALGHGKIILPDTANGRGPLYFCLLRKTA